MRKRIIERALMCVDEIYPEDNSVNIQNFPLDNFIDEAARRVLLSAPLHAIPSARSFSDVELHDNGDGSGWLVLPGDFIRLVRFRMEGWHRPVLAALTDDDPAYKRQFHAATRGGNAKPVVVLSHGKTRLEYYTIPSGRHSLSEALYIPFVRVDKSFPANLVEVTAWVLASLVLGVSNDSKGAETATARANELITIL